MIDKDQLISDLIALGLQEGDLVNVKVSLKSIGKIDGGIITLIDALSEVVGDDGTLICDSFVKPHYSFLKFFYRNNISNKNTVSYAGAFTNIMLKHPKAFRSNHPIQSFCAIGKKAKELTENFTETSKPYDFLHQIAKLGGKNLRIGDKVIGVGTTHIAICELGYKEKYVPQGIYFFNNAGEKKYYRKKWASGCNNGFNKLMPYYLDGGALIGKGFVGNAESMLTNMSKSLQIEMELFKTNPNAFLCNSPDCVCSFTWKHSKFSFQKCFMTNLKRKKYKRLLYISFVNIFGRWQG